MFRTAVPIGVARPTTGWGCAAALALGLALAAGCCADRNLHEAPVHQDDSASAQVRRLREADPDTAPVGLSSKAQQVEKDFGIQ
ncbi:MAG: hypothetical protein ABSF26_17855 [Thermoguttaceae bacterium]|jgi:hypothetical protein